MAVSRGLGWGLWSCRGFESVEGYCFSQHQRTCDIFSNPPHEGEHCKRAVRQIIEGRANSYYPLTRTRPGRRFFRTTPSSCLPVCGGSSLLFLFARLFASLATTVSSDRAASSS